MQVLNLMTADPVSVGSHDTLAQAKAIMDEGHFRRLPVVDGEQLIGILTERDIREHTGYLESTRVTAAMRTALITLGPRATVEEAARVMLRHKIGGVPIIDDGKLVGIVTTSDLLKAFLAMVEASHHGAGR
jgi:acetoin utilization protein AcuB